MTSDAEQLLSLSKQATSRIPVTHGNIKKLSAAQSLLYMRRDMAKKEIRDSIQRFICHQMAAVQTRLEEEVDSRCEAEEERISDLKQSCQEHIAQLVRQITHADQILEPGQQRAPLQQYTQCSRQISQLLQVQCHVNLQEIGVLEFVSNKECAVDSSIFGYVKVSKLEPSQVRIVATDDSTNGFVGIEELVCVETSSEDIKADLQHLSVCVLDPRGERINCSVEYVDIKAGSVVYSYTPSNIGIHTVNIHLYKQNVVGSPLVVTVMERKYDVDDQEEAKKTKADRKSALGNKSSPVKKKRERVKIANAALSSIGRYIEQNSKIEKSRSPVRKTSKSQTTSCGADSKLSFSSPKRKLSVTQCDKFSNPAFKGGEPLFSKSEPVRDLNLEKFAPKCLQDSFHMFQERRGGVKLEKDSSQSESDVKRAATRDTREQDGESDRTCRSGATENRDEKASYLKDLWETSGGNCRFHFDLDGRENLNASPTAVPCKESWIKKENGTQLVKDEYEKYSDAKIIDEKSVEKLACNERDCDVKSNTDQEVCETEPKVIKADPGEISKKEWQHQSNSDCKETVKETDENAVKIKWSPTPHCQIRLPARVLNRSTVKTEDWDSETSALQSDVPSIETSSAITQTPASTRHHLSSSDTVSESDAPPEDIKPDLKSDANTDFCQEAIDVLSEGRGERSRNEVISPRSAASSPLTWASKFVQRSDTNTSRQPPDDRERQETCNSVDSQIYPIKKERSMKDERKGVKNTKTRVKSSDVDKENVAADHYNTNPGRQASSKSSFHDNNRKDVLKKDYSNTGISNDNGKEKPVGEVQGVRSGTFPTSGSKEGLEDGPGNRPRCVSPIMCVPKKHNILANHISQRAGKDIDATEVCCFGEKGHGIQGDLYFPIGVTSTNYWNVIVCDNGNDMVKMFSRYGEHICTIGGEPGFLSRPSAVAIGRNWRVFVKDHQQILVFEASGVHLFNFGMKHLAAPYGLSITKDEEVLVLDMKKRDPAIVRFTQEGVFIKRSPYRPVLSDPKSKCRFLTTYEDKLIVTDLGLNKVYVSDLDGNLLQKFGQRGNKAGEFNEPSGVTVDSRGNLLIADSKNNRIQVYSLEGKYLCQVRMTYMSDRFIKRPSDIHLTSNGHLIVVSGFCEPVTVDWEPIGSGTVVIIEVRN